MQRCFAAHIRNGDPAQPHLMGHAVVPVWRRAISLARQIISHVRLAAFGAPAVHCRLWQAQRHCRRPPRKQPGYQRTPLVLELPMPQALLSLVLLEQRQKEGPLLGAHSGAPSRCLYRPAQPRNTLSHLILWRQQEVFLATARQTTRLPAIRRVFPGERPCDYETKCAKKTVISTACRDKRRAP